MTIFEVLDKYDICYTKIGNTMKANMFSVGNINCLFKVNKGNVFKLDRKTFDILRNDCEEYRIILFDSVNKKYYYLKLKNNNNWLSGGFDNCQKDELFLGKQVLNYQNTINSILTELKRLSAKK